MTNKVLIVGAGPSGILLALYLLRRPDYQVEIYELRSDPRVNPQVGASNYPLILCQRGLAACRQIKGLESEIELAGIGIEGAICFNNSRRRYRSDRQKLVSINRKTLVMTLLNYLEKNYGSDRLKIHFEHRYLQTDLEQKQAEFEQVSSSTNNFPEQTRITAPYDLLIGSDGVHSRVRKDCLEGSETNFEKKSTHLKYKTLFLNSLNADTATTLELGRVYGWRSPDGVTLLASRQRDRTVGCTLFVRDRQKTLDQFHTKEEVLNFFNVNFEEIASSISPQEAEDFSQRSLAPIWTVSCDSYHYRDSILIIGDAAHAISPSIGQGCNSALEDVMVLDSLLDRYGDDWAKVLPKYSQSRVADAHAVRELADHALPLSKWMFILFIIRLTINRTLHRLFPQLFSLPFFDLIPNTTVAYSEIHRSAQHWIALVKKTNERYLNRV
ncbi:MAG: NAD(P)/FAD-dependent oxidoreductase [Cyanobacteria bacterium J06635_13]